MIQGYVLLWGDVAAVEGGLFESFTPYPFAAPICAHLTCSHDQRPGAVLARTSSGALQLDQDDLGLRIQASGRGREWSQLVRAVRGGLRGASFTYRPVASDRDGELITVTKARCTEVCITGDPAYAAGGLWLEGEHGLPDHLDRLRNQFDANIRANRPRPVATEPAPRPQAVHSAPQRDNPIRQMARAHVVRYLAGMPR
jgi:hypothetical protein